MGGIIWGLSFIRCGDENNRPILWNAILGRIQRIYLGRVAVASSIIGKASCECLTGSSVATVVNMHRLQIGALLSGA